MFLVKASKVNGELKYDILGKVLIGEIDFEHDDLQGSGMNAHIDIDAHIADDLSHVPDGAAVGLYLTFENDALVWKSIPTVSNDVDVNTQTLSADKTLSFLSPQYHFLAASGKKVILPNLGTDEHKEFTLFCTSGNFRIQDTSNTIVDTVYAGNYKSYIWTGTEWKGTSVGSTIGTLSKNLIIGKGAKAINGVAIGESADSNDGVAVGNGAKNISKSEAFGTGQAVHFNSIAHHGATSQNISEEVRNIHQGNGAEPAHASELLWYLVQDNGVDENELLLAGANLLAQIPFRLGVLAYRVTVIGRSNQYNKFCRFEFNLSISRFNADKAVFPNIGSQVFPIHQLGAPHSYLIIWEKSDSDFGVMVCAGEEGEWTWTCRMTGIHHEVNG